MYKKGQCSYFRSTYPQLKTYSTDFDSGFSDYSYGDMRKVRKTFENIPS